MREPAKVSVVIEQTLREIQSSESLEFAIDVCTSSVNEVVVIDRDGSTSVIVTACASSSAEEDEKGEDDKDEEV